jgi:hypothetical protein
MSPRSENVAVLTKPVSTVPNLVEPDEIRTRRPSACKADALPTELRPRNWSEYAVKNGSEKFTLCDQLDPEALLPSTIERDHLNDASSSP